MAERDTTFEINRDIIDFGDRVVAVRQIASVGCRRSHPLRLLGVALLLAACAGLAYEAVMTDGLAALRSGGSSKIWLMFVLAGIAVFAIVYQRRALVIALADGSKIRLHGGNNDFQERVVSCIGDAMKAGPGETFTVAVDVRAQTIGSPGATGEPGPQAQTASRQPPMQPPTDRAGAAPQARMWPPQAAAVGPANGLAHPQIGATHNGAGGYGPSGSGYPAKGPDPAVNAHDTRSEMMPAGLAPGWSPDPGAPTNGAFPGNPGSGATDMNTSRGDAHPAGLRPLRDASNPLRDMETLVEFVRRTDIQHKSALLELLGVAHDYLQGGSTGRDEAIAHWHSFSDYVHRYLATVDGLAPLTDRASHPFAPH